MASRASVRNRKIIAKGLSVALDGVLNLSCGLKDIKTVGKPNRRTPRYVVTLGIGISCSPQVLDWKLNPLKASMSIPAL